MLRKSGQIRRDLNQLKPFCGIEGVQFSMSVTKWDSQIPQYPGMDLRGFVYGVRRLLICTHVCVHVRLATVSLTGWTISLPPGG